MSIETSLSKLLATNKDYLDNDGCLLKQKLISLALEYDKELILTLLSDKQTKEHYFITLDEVIVFNFHRFISTLTDPTLLIDTPTHYANTIGLRAHGKLLSTNANVVLDFPFKDCVLQGGASNDEKKYREIFLNTTLNPDEINRLFDAKILTNTKRYSTTSKINSNDITKSTYSLNISECTDIKRDEKGNIKDNLLIKGNNLLALHSLKSNFANKIKLIYIDPPYNTGKDSFNYNDNFNHSTWLTFMKNRLEVARELLRDDGVIFINLDDREAHYAKVLSDEIFGRENFVANVIWQKKYSPSNDAKWISDNHDHILIFAKNKHLFKVNLLQRTEEMNKRYTNPDNDPRGEWKAGGFSVKTYSKDYDYPITTPTGRIVYPPKGSCWQTSQEKYFEKVEDNRIYFGKKGDSKPQIKQFLTEVQQGIVPKTIWLHDEVGHNQISRMEITKLFGTFDFATPKPESLLKRIIEISTCKDDIVLDFFAGSGTTNSVAHKMGRQWIAIEQMDYIENITRTRMEKVLEGEDGGVSKVVEWQGGGEFVYTKLAKDNQTYIDKITKIDESNIISLHDEIIDKGFLKYYINKEVLKSEAKEFKALSLIQQKEVLISILESNSLYKNYSEIDDENLGVSTYDKKINKEFYYDYK